MVNYDEFWDFVKENNAVILDVRTSKEFAGGYIEGAININVDDLRENLQNLDKERDLNYSCFLSRIRPL
jgi:rhodanese-related sulfurtransferase